MGSINRLIFKSKKNRQQRKQREKPARFFFKYRRVEIACPVLFVMTHFQK